MAGYLGGAGLLGRLDDLQRAAVLGFAAQVERHAMNADKLRGELGWRPRRTFEDGLAETVTWYRANTTWTERVRSGAYRDYYDRQYASRLASAKP